MGEREAVAELSSFSSANASATAWKRGRQELPDAELYWLSTVRPDGRPHVTPLLGLWLDARCASAPARTSARQRISSRSGCVLTPGRNWVWDGGDAL
jgi:hypothetical protein